MLEKVSCFAVIFTPDLDLVGEHDWKPKRRMVLPVVVGRNEKKGEPVE